jgi:hypothetical protein
MEGSGPSARDPAASVALVGIPSRVSAHPPPLRKKELAKTVSIFEFLVESFEFRLEFQLNLSCCSQESTHRTGGAGECDITHNHPSYF